MSYEYRSFGVASLVRKVSRTAAEHGCNGDLYDDEQRNWREPSEPEKCLYLDIFRDLASQLNLQGKFRELVEKLVLNAVMNSEQFKRDLAV